MYQACVNSIWGLTTYWILSKRPPELVSIGWDALFFDIFHGCREPLNPPAVYVATTTYFDSDTGGSCPSVKDLPEPEMDSSSHPPAPPNKSHYSTVQQRDTPDRNLAFQHNDTSDTFSFENEIPPDLPSKEQPHVAEYRDMASEAKQTIALALAAILLPMLGLTALLLGLILANRVEKQSGSLGFTQLSDTDDSAYYVDFNATALATISSWSATVAPLLAVAAMSLASFPIARRFKSNSRSECRDLPTPFQFSMLLESLTGTIGAFFSLGRYSLWPHKASFAPLVGVAFFVLLVSSLTGYAITGVDTWLHLVIETVNVDVGSSQTPSATYGRGMADVSCVNDTQNFNLVDTRTSGECGVARLSTGYYLTRSSEAYKTLGNLSDINTVRTVQVNDHTIAYLGPASIPHNLDYQATTLGIGTQCTPITQKCNLTSETASETPFRCSKGFYGDLYTLSIAGRDFSTNNAYTQPITGMVWFDDAALTRYANNSYQNNLPHNPYHLGVWTISQQNGPLDSADIVYTLLGSMAWLLNCSTTVYDLTYSWVNGTVRSTNLTKGNVTMGSTLQYPSYLSVYTQAWMDMSAYLASAEPDGKSLAQAWSTSYSKIAMGLTAGFLSTRTNLQEQVRTTKLVSRVPKVPLYFLVALNMVYATLGGVLAFVALVSKPNESNDVRERMSIVGLVAYAFEGARARKPVEKKRQMFAEHNNEGDSRVGIERSVRRGWEYTTTLDSAKTGSDHGS